MIPRVLKHNPFLPIRVPLPPLNQTSSWTTISGIQLSPPPSIGSTDSLYFNEVNMQGDKTLALGTGGLSAGGIAVDYATTDSPNNLVISAGGILTLNAATLNGNGADSAGPGYATAGILLNRATGGSLTINSDIALGAKQFWISARTTGGMTIAGAVNLNSFELSTNIAAGTSTISGAVSGAGSLRKIGDGILILSGDNPLAGGVTLSNGVSIFNILEVGHANALGSGTFKARGGVLRSSTAGLILANPVDVAAGGFRVGGVNDFTLSGTTTLDNASRTVANYGTATVTLGGIATVAGSVVAFDNAADAANGGPIIVSGAITGEGAVVLSGKQKTILNGVNTYTGTTTVSGGSISGSGTLPTTVAMSGGSITLAGGATTGGALTFKAGAAFTGSPTAVFNTPPVVGRSYDVFNYTGTITSLASLKSPSRGTFADTGTKVTFTPLAANQDRTWNTTTGIWDGIGANANWAQGDQKFYNGDSASFPEPAAASIVTIEGNITPTAVTISNTTNDYTFFYGANNSGTITGTASLVKSGSGTVTFESRHSYSGGTTIDGGVLNLIKGGEIGGIQGIATINAGGTLRLSTGDAMGYSKLTAKVHTVNINGGTLDANVAGNQTLSNATVNMTGGTITGVAGSSLNFYRGASTLNTFPSATTSTISGVIITPLRGQNTTFTVADGEAPVDLQINSSIQHYVAGDAAGLVLTKAGAGHLKLTGVSTLDRSFNIAAGTLEIGGAGQLGSGNYSATISNSGVLAFSSSANQTLAGVISGTGPLIKSGSGVLTLAAFNDFTGPVSVTGGTLVVNGSLTASSNVSVATGGTLKGRGFVDGDVTLESGGNLAGSDMFGDILTMGSLTFASTGAIHLAELQSYTANAPIASDRDLTVNGGAGSVTVNLPSAPIPAGTYHIIKSPNTLANASSFVLGTAPALGGRQTGTLVANPTYLDYQVTGTNDDSATTYAVTIPAAVNPVSGIFDNSVHPYTISGAGGIAGAATRVVMTGLSEVTLNSANTYGGGTMIDSGTLTMGNAAALGSGPVTLDAGTLGLGAYEVANDIASNGGTLAGSAFQVNGVISGTSLTINAGGIVKFSGVNTCTGATTMASGGLEITGAGQLNSGTYAGAISNPALLRFDTTADQRLSGAISGAGQLVKNNSNTLTLSANPAYTGATTINGGTLVLGSPNYTVVKTTSFDVKTGATLQVNAANSVYYQGGASVTIDGGTLTLNAEHNHFGPLTLLNGATLRGIREVAPYANEYSTFDADFSVGGNATSTIAGGNPAFGYSLNSPTRSITVDSTGDASGVDLLVTSRFIGNGNTGLTKRGEGVMKLTGASTYEGDTIVSLGTLDLSTTGQLYTGKFFSSKVVITGGILKVNNLGYNETPGSVASLGGLRDYGSSRQINGGTLEVVGAGHSTSNNFFVGDNPFVPGVSTLRYAPAVATDTLEFTGNTNTNIEVVGPFIIDTRGNVTISEIIEGPGSLIKTGSQTLTLSGSNTYLGDTTVNAGVLVVNGNAIADTGTLIINGGKVAPSAMETVNSLYFGVEQQASGTWGATGSNAENIDDAHFSGSSVIMVAGGGYSDWAATNAPAQTAAEDYDGDGVSNGSSAGWAGRIPGILEPQAFGGIRGFEM